ncbi:MAG: carbohydrate ABC transporter substrate-binding protein [Chloroflexi bacterium]|nr:carbohydrate ABC transporter substrate-binding protein [Chloroflexota bacterium]
MSRKILPVVFIAVLTAIVAMPRTPTTAQQQDQVLYSSFYGGSTHGAWERQMVAEYQAPNDEVELLHRATAIYSQPVPLRSLDQEIASDSHADVITGFIGGGALLNYIEQGYLADISDLWAEMGWYDDYPQSVIDMATVDGKQYFVPMAFQWNPVFYRADIFESLGLTPPETWDELLGLCDTLHAEGYIPFTVSVAGWNPPVARWFTMLNLRLNGPKFHERLMRGQESYEDERVRNVFEHWTQLFEHNCFAEDVGSTNYGGAVDQLTGGEAVMYLLGEWLYESLDPGEGELLDFYRFPVIDPDVSNGEIVHYYGAYLHADAANPEAARDFLRHLGSPAVQTQIVTEVNRAVATSAIDRAIMPDYQQRGVEFVANSGYLVPLLEVSNLNQRMANRMLNLLSVFMRTWNEPGRIDQTLSELETVRLEQIGD